MLLDGIVLKILISYVVKRVCKKALKHPLSELKYIVQCWLSERLIGYQQVNKHIYTQK